jgi:peptidoglycan/xylan/chitin deacetylase (PgdA/CDA1 family)
MSNAYPNEDWRVYNGEPAEPYAIMFHHFHHSYEKPYGQGSLTADEFECIIRFIESKKKNRVIDAKVFAELYQSKTLEPWHVCLTFDDNLGCQFNVATPVLKKLHLKAFFFIYTCIYDNIYEKLESYKYFQGKCYTSLEAFYDAFFLKAQNMYGDSNVISSHLESEECKSFRSHVQFYTTNDRRFRYLRDVVLESDDFQSIISSMMEEKGFTVSEYSNEIWMTKTMVRKLHDDGHVVGLHSHSHHTGINNISKTEQMDEYKKNKAYIANLFTPPVWAMSHPLGHYNDDSIAVLEELGIHFGFTTKPIHGATRYEIPRIDHSLIFKKMQDIGEKG